MKTATENNFPQFRIEVCKTALNLKIKGKILLFDSNETLREISDVLKKRPQVCRFIDDGITDWDSSLLLVLYETMRLAGNLNIPCDAKSLPQNLQDLLKLAFAVDRKPEQRQKNTSGFLERVGQKTLALCQISEKVLDFICASFTGICRFFCGRSVMRKIDFLDALQECGPRALGIVSLISFLVGLILAFVGAVQLQEFGAQIYIASLVTIGMCRIMGAIMVGIIMAGRTGSSYAASIGTMQVNEELDALQTMGISLVDFLVLPRIFALIIALPILTMLSDFAGVVGGAFIGIFLMDLPSAEYWKYAADAFNLGNFLVGLFHSFCFGLIISLTGCYQGINCGRNADSVGLATTRSVVCAIVWMIIVTGIITVICQELGL